MTVRLAALKLKPSQQLEHEFVEYIPEKLAAGKLYVSVEFATVSHRCCCGCGQEVVTPLSPTDWKLIYDGQSISLYPSIGNWSFACRSHYWIEKNRVHWAEAWSDERIAAGRDYERAAKEAFYGQAPASPEPVPATADKPVGGLWAWIRRFFLG